VVYMRCIFKYVFRRNTDKNDDADDEIEDVDGYGYIIHLFGTSALNHFLPGRLLKERSLSLSSRIWILFPSVYILYHYSSVNGGSVIALNSLPVLKTCGVYRDELVDPLLRASYKNLVPLPGCVVYCGILRNINALTDFVLETCSMYLGSLMHGTRV